MRSALALLFVCASLAPVRAQSPAVDPLPFEWAIAARETGFPFGHPNRTVLRYQEVHDGMTGRPRTVTGIAIRRSPLDSHAVGAFTADLSMRLSTARTTAATIDPRFAANTGPDEVQVLPRRTVSFPASPGVTTLPAPFEYVVPADVPFAFGGAGPLCVDLTMHSHSNVVPTRFELHAEGYSHVGEIGEGCGGLALATLMGYPDVVHDVTGAPPGAPVVMLFGSGFETTAGLPLPIDLGPIGAPDCALHLDPAVALSGFADPSGALQTIVPVATLAPGVFYGVQAVAVQPGLNALGAVTSNATIVVPYTGRVVGRVWAEDLQSTTGLPQPVFGLVIEVR